MNMRVLNGKAHAFKDFLLKLVPRTHISEPKVNVALYSVCYCLRFSNTMVNP